MNEEGIRSIYEELDLKGKDIEEFNIRYSRFLANGNAGGTIATLGLIGTTLGAGEGAPIPTAIVCLLFVFICGLCFVWGALIVESRSRHLSLSMHQEAHKSIVDDASHDEIRAPMLTSYRTINHLYNGWRALNWAAFTFLVAGVGTGGWQLLKLTTWYAATTAASVVP